MSIDTILWASGILAESVVIGLLIYRRSWRSFPLFLTYNIWTLLGSVAVYTLFSRLRNGYVEAYLAFTIIDGLLLFCVLTELGLAILRPIRSSLPRITPVIVALLIVGLGAAIWPFAAFPGASQLSHVAALITRLEQDVSVLRVLTFLALVASSQFLAIGFRDREMQIATGLGFYSLVGLAVALLHTHQATADQYSHWNRIVVASYLCSMAYWIFSFSHKGAERREMTPQMQSLLLTLAGSAHSARTAMASSHSRGKRDP